MPLREQHGYSFALGERKAVTYIASDRIDCPTRLMRPAPPWRLRNAKVTLARRGGACDSFSAKHID
jgi:hypothetical protein